MIVLNCEQGSPEWIDARLGIPTASEFKKIVTATGRASEQSGRYLAKCAAEWFLGQPVDDVRSQFMERGSAMEPEARAFYAREFAGFDGPEVVQVGFCLRDDRKVGASPDSLVGDDGLLEIKCPSAEVHMTYVLGGLTDEYRVQVQGQLWITGRAWCDLLSFNPVLPPAKVRIARDPEFIDAMAKGVDAFIARLDAAKEKLADAKAARDAKLAELREQEALAANHIF